MKLSISKGEWYPVFSIHKDDGDKTNRVVEVSEEKYAAWKALFDRFEMLQQKLSAIYGSQEKKE